MLLALRAGHLPLCWATFICHPSKIESGRGTTTAHLVHDTSMTRIRTFAPHLFLRQTRRKVDPFPLLTSFRPHSPLSPTTLPLSIPFCPSSRHPPSYSSFPTYSHTSHSLFHSRSTLHGTHTFINSLDPLGPPSYLYRPRRSETPRPANHQWHSIQYLLQFSSGPETSRQPSQPPL